MPERWGGFLLVRQLGGGSTSEVFLARDERGRLAAVKVLRAAMSRDPGMRAAFGREIDISLRLRGPRFADVLAAEPDAARPWFATAYVPATTLQSSVARHGPLGADRLEALAHALVAALAALHTQGLVHRDVKPANVLLTADRPRLIDFGLTCRTEEVRPPSGLIMGTPGFIAPEQAGVEPCTPAVDVFAFGATLAFAATGRTPFGGGDPVAVIHRSVHRAPDAASLPPGPVGDLIRRCLAKRPEERPGLGAVLADLRTSRF